MSRRDAGTTRVRPALIALLLLVVGGLALTTAPASGAFTARIANSTDTVGSATSFLCAPTLDADKGTALFQWSLADPASTTTVADISGNGRNGAYQGTRSVDGAASPACPRDGGTAWSLDGTSSYADFATGQTNPTVFTLEVWFRTTVKGGCLVGFGSAATGSSGKYDRHLYINTDGAVTFGVYPGAMRTITSPTGGYADGSWHYAAATLSSAGMALYLDGRKVSSSTATTTAENVTGYWRVGYNTLAGWPLVATNAYFKGSLRYAAVYTSALTAAQIANHFGAGSGT